MDHAVARRSWPGGRATPTAASGRARRLGPGPSPALLCTGLTSDSGGRTTVSGVSFAVARGEAYGLLGKPGAGTSTTLRMACGALAPDAGFVRLAGRPAAGPGTAGCQVWLPGAAGYVPRAGGLVPTLSVGENLWWTARALGVARRERRARIGEALALVGLAGPAGLDRREARHHGPGTRRLAALAAALMHRPALVVLAHPTGGLCPQEGAALWAAFGRARAAGTALLVSGRHLDELAGCDRVGVLDRGRMMVEATPAVLAAEFGAGPLAPLVGPAGTPAAGPAADRGRDARVEPDRDPGSAPW